MIKDKIGYSYNDLTIIPSDISYIESRSQCNPYYIDKQLPIFTAPMTSVVDENNYSTFESNGITPIIPRSVDLQVRVNLMNKEVWVALSLKEFEDLFINNSKERLTNHVYNICVDIANGHMFKLYDLCSRIKLRFPNLVIMTGNIANPETFSWITTHNRLFGNVIDYIRLSVGSGAGCITASNTGIHYPIASLIDGCNKLKTSDSPKIIADGGIRNYSDVIKALALGADYVMIGSLFAQCEESAAEKEFLDDTLYAKFFGMASADGQKAINGEKTKTAEGITKRLPILYTLEKWTNNMADYLRSAMSYTNCTSLKEFIGTQELIINSIGELNAVNK